MRGGEHQRIDLTLRRRRHHDEPLDARNLGRNRVHQHRGRIGSAPARDIDARRIDAAPARTEANPRIVGGIAVGRFLLLVIGSDPVAREFERGAQIGLQPVISSGKFGRFDPPAALIQIMAVEFLGKGADRGVAFIPHRGGDDAHVALDIRIRFAPGIDQIVERRREPRLAGIEPDHAA
ncbi:hypothetical protein GCM10011329_20530 [Stakelama pacifica]|nr:hypothetical protein GCM10011329_20530 [Stakelama pacifica]